MNSFKVTICSKEFALKTEDEPIYYINLAKKLESQIYGMSKTNDSMTVFNSALLVALAASDEAKKANDSIDNIRTQIKEYVDDACLARSERDDALKEIAGLIKQKDELAARVSVLENEIEILKMQKNIEEQMTLESVPVNVKKVTNKY